jgi:hypothetical protein
LRATKKEGKQSKNPDTTGSVTDNQEKRKRRERIKESRCNRKCERSMTGNSGVPGERESRKERKMMERFRCGNEERKTRYWLEGEGRRCRMCYEERHTIDKGTGRNTE